VAFSSDGKSIITGSLDSTANIWNTESRLCNSAHEYEEKSCAASSFAYSSNGRSIVIGTWDHTAMVWDIESGKRLKILEGHSTEVTRVAYSSDGRFIMTEDCDDVFYWNSTTFKRVKGKNNRIVLSLPVSEQVEVVQDHFQVPIDNCVSFTMDVHYDESNECNFLRHANSREYDAHVICGETVMLWRFP
jgi:WD40 repeat protein